MQPDVAVLAPVEPQQGQQIVMEVLEWGKYCATPNGAITDGAEHQMLGATEHFPDLLIKLCQPEDIGISKGQLEEEAQRLFERVPYGTGLRPVLVEGKVLPVFYRVGVRSEGGSVLARRRKYSLARYLVARTSMAPPLALFKAMSPLIGLTKEMAETLKPIQAYGPRMEEAVPEPFLKQALTYIISGIPIHLKMPETEFFRLVEQVWHALPESVRPLLSAGWNISSSMASEFGIFSAGAPSEQCAVYSAAAGWSTPRSFQKSPVPGELYSALYFDSAGSQKQSLIERYLSAPGAPVRISRSVLNTVPGFRDPAILSRFQEAGTSVLENALLERLQDWLVTGSSAVARQLQTIVSKVLARPELKSLIKIGLADVDSRQRADQLAWIFLSSKEPLYADIEVPGQPGSRRGMLLQTVARGDAHLALKSLAAAVFAGEADRLPSEVISRIPGLLSSTLDDVKVHWDLLCASDSTNVYSVWATEHAVELALQFGSSDLNLVQPVLEKLRELSGPNGTAAPALAVIAKLATGQRGNKEERTIVSRMPPNQIGKFCGLLETIWRQADAQHIDRAVLLDWCAGLPHRYDDPALALASGATITPAQMNTVLRQSSTLPQPFLRKLSGAALDAARNARDILAYIHQYRTSWAPVVALWPPKVALTLLGNELHDPQQTAHDSEWQLNEDFFPSAEVIQDTIEEWLLSPKSLDGLLQAAPVIWTWIKALPGLEGNDLSAVDICWCLAHRKFAKDSKVNPTPYDETHLAMTLARFSGQYEQLTRDVASLWRSAAQGWQIKLLLELFPAVEFSPSVEQLAALISFRGWLQVHLNRVDIPASRRTVFKIATAGLQTIPYPGRDDQKWSEQWQGSVLMAVYRELPAEQPPLTEVFQAYASSPAEKAQICLKYLLATNSDDEFGKTLLKIVQAFLFPSASEGELSTEQLQKVVRAGAEPASKRSIQIVADSECPPLEQRRTGVVAVAAYMIPLLWLIANRGFGSVLQKLIEKHYAAINIRLKA